MTLCQDSGPAVFQPGAATIRIAIVDGNVFFRAGLRHFLSAEDAFVVVAESATVREAETDLRGQQPDVALVGVDSAPTAILHDLARLRGTVPRVRIIALLAQDDPVAVNRVLVAGARAAIPQQATPDELAGTIRGVARGDNWVVLSVSQRTLAGLREAPSNLLTVREREVVMLVARGLRNSQIADHLVITEGTVKRHLSNVYAKLDAACRTEAVRKAMERGVIPAVTTGWDRPGSYNAAG